VPAPWYEHFPLDFVSENLVPGRIKDQRVFTYHLTPVRIVPPEEVLNNGTNLRNRAGGGTVIEAPSSPAPPRPPETGPPPPTP
jgi:hypothetical protein